MMISLQRRTRKAAFQVETLTPSVSFSPDMCHTAPPGLLSSLTSLGGRVSRIWPLNMANWVGGT